MRQIGEYLIKQGFKDVYLREVDKKIEIIYSSYGITFGESSTEVRVYDGNALPNEIEKIDKVVSPIFEGISFLKVQEKYIAITLLQLK